MIPTITLIIPQAIEPLALWQRDFDFKFNNPIHKQLFNAKYSKTLPAKGTEETLLYLAGLHEKSISLATWRYAAQFGELPTQPILCADLVQLESGLDCVNLVPQLPSISTTDMERVSKVLNPFLAQDGLKWVGKDNVGYLLADKQLVIKTTPISQVLGQNIFSFLPQAEKQEQLYWHRLLNEIQMLLHPPQLGQSTTQDYNAMWLWGNGEDSSQYESTIKQLVGNSLVLEAIAWGIKAKYSTLSSFNMSNTLIIKDTIIVLDQLVLPALQDDFTTWQDSWNQLEKDWLQPLVNLAKQKKIKLRVSCGSGNLYQVMNKPFWQFWG